MPRPDELRGFAKDHLLYEVEMFSLLTARLLKALAHDAEAGKRDLDWLDIETRNAQVESFAIHTRALLGFLYEPRHSKPDDAMASHFVPDGWKPPPLRPALQRVGPRVGKEVAHLTYGRLRVDEEAKGWPYGQIWLDVAAVLREFLAQASPELLPEEVARKIHGLTAPPSNTGTITEALSTTHGGTSLGI
jgi:hypothetical protein